MPIFWVQKSLETVIEAYCFSAHRRCRTDHSMDHCIKPWAIAPAI